MTLTWRQVVRIGVLVCGVAVALSVLLLLTSLGLSQTHAQTTVSGTEQCPLKNDIFLNPFNKNSAHHRPIGTGAQYADASHPAVRDWNKANRFAVNVAAPVGVSLFKVTNSDPTRTVGATPACNGRDLPKVLHFPVGGIQINENQHNVCGDAMVVLYNSSTGQGHQIRAYRWNNGNPSAQSHFEWSMQSLGHGSSHTSQTGPTRGTRVGSSASGIAAMFGLLRGVEINTPGMPIRHAMQIALPRLDNGCLNLISRDVLLPAVGGDGNMYDGNNNAGNIPYGSLWAIPPSVNIDALGLSEPGKRFAEAIRDYGIYVVDGGGCGNGAIRADQFVDQQIRQQLVNSDIPKIYPLMRMVTNSEWQPGGAPAGGGTPIAPNCAYDAPADGPIISTPIAPTDGTSGGGTSGGTTGGGTVGGGVQQGQAGQATCHAILPGRVVPNGYGAPYSFFAATQQLLIRSADCGQQSIEVAVGAPGAYVFNRSYVWGGVEWDPVTLSGPAASGSWINGEASGSFRRRGPTMWYVAFICENVAGAWRCGCSDQSCTQSRWQVQRFDASAYYNPGAVGSGSTGGGTPGGSGSSGGGGTTVPDGESQGHAGTYTGDAELVAPSGGADGNRATPNVSQCVNSPTHNYIKTMPTANPRASLSNAKPCSERYEVHWQLELNESDIGKPAVDVLNNRYGSLGNSSQFSMGGHGLGKQSVTVARGPGNVLAFQRNVQPGVIPNTTYQFDNFPQGTPAICISMQVYIPSDFVGNEVGSYKLGYGVWGGPHADGGGISPLVQRDNPNRGWVVRNTWNGRTTHLYQYHLNRGVRSSAWGYCDANCRANDAYRSSISDSQGCRLFGDVGVGGTVTKGRWVRIEEEVVGNSTPTSYDGYSRLWIDGKQIGEVTGQHFGSMPIRGLFVNDMWGGSITAPGNQARTNEKYWLASYTVYK